MIIKLTTMLNTVVQTAKTAFRECRLQGRPAWPAAGVPSRLGALRYISHIIGLNLALFLCLCAPTLPAQDQTAQTEASVSSDGSAAVSKNEDTKVEMDMYVEYLPDGAGSSLKMDVTYYRGGEKPVQDHPDSETGLMNNSELVWLWPANGWFESQFHALVPVSVTSAQVNNSTWMQSSVYRMHDRAANRIYKTPVFKQDKVKKYRLHYRVPEGFEMYSRPLDSNGNPSGIFRPGSILDSETAYAPFDVPAFETVVLPKNAPGALPGKATSVNSGNAEIRFSLGFLPSGKSAGYLDFLHNLKHDPLSPINVELDKGDYFDNVIAHEFRLRPGAPPKASDLRAVTLSDEEEVEIITQRMPILVTPSMSVPGTGIRQVIAPQCIADVSRGEQGELVIKFYHPAQKHGRTEEPLVSAAPFDFSGEQPFVTYTISWKTSWASPEEANGAPTQGDDYSVTITYYITREENGVKYYSDFSTKTVFPFIPYKTDWVIPDWLDDWDPFEPGADGNCPYCDGTGICPACDGEGGEDCYACGGTGHCQDCEGSGNCQYCDGTAECDTCGGTGTCATCGGTGEGLCETCNGSGYVDGYTPEGEEDPGELCPDCDGTGNDKCCDCSGSGECQDCDGTGECSECSGTGKCSTCDGSKKCSECNGAGRFYCDLCHGFGDCIFCHGSGLSDDAKMYMDLSDLIDLLLYIMQGGGDLSEYLDVVDQIYEFTLDGNINDPFENGYPIETLAYDGHMDPAGKTTSHTIVHTFNTIEDALDTEYEASSVSYQNWNNPFPEGDIQNHYIEGTWDFYIDFSDSAYDNYYPRQDTDLQIDNISTASSRHYAGSFPAFNPSYMFAMRGAGYIADPEFHFTQETQVLASITEGDQGLTTAFGYYRTTLPNTPDAKLPHDFYHGRLKWQTNPDGSWIMYDYSTDMASLGQVTTVVTPWLGAPMPAEIPSSGSYCITTYTYAPDWEGVKRLPAEIIKTVNGQTIGRTVNAYSGASVKIYQSGTFSMAPVWSTTSTAYASSGSTMVTISKVFEGANCPSELYGLPYSTQAPDGSKESVAYQRGNYSATTKIFTASSTGSGFRSVVLKGIANTTTSTQPLSDTVSFYDDIPIDPIRMCLNISTAEVTIRDQFAHTIRSETRLFKGGSNWETIDSADMQYDTAGNLTRRQKLNGTLYEATYSGGLKTWEKDEQGLETTFVYDTRGRVSSTTRKAIGPLQALTTTFEYDNENRVTKTTVGTGDDELATEKKYDRTGRVIEETTQGLTTSYEYTVENGILIKTTVTLPGGATRIIENYRDGRPKSITGSAAPAEYYDYDIGTDGFITTTKTTGSDSRWVKTTTDWLGRTVEQTQPAPAGSGAATVTQKTFYNDKGQAVRTETPGLAPTLYFYDANGVMNKHGLSISGNANLDGTTDRKYTFNYDYRQKPGETGLWNYSETFAYPDGATTGVAQTKTWTRVTGLGSSGDYGTLIAESIAEDANGNQARTQTYLNRATGETTTLTKAPFATEAAVAKAVAGLLVEQVSPAGVKTTYEYDALQRPIKTTDARTGDTTITYETNTTRIKTITDPQPITQHTYTYEKDSGRLIKDETPQGDSSSTKLASNYDYDIRGRLTEVSGDVPYRVTYKYNDYNQRIEQRTYRTSDGDPTTFDYDAVTGVLLKRTDAQGYFTEYSYTPLGQLASRTWPGLNTTNTKVTTTYTYDEDTGALTDAKYSDDTHPLSYKYDRLGRIKTITDATGTRTFTYRDTVTSSHAADLKPDQEQLPAFYNNRILANQYADGTGRYTGLKVKNGTAEDYSVAYTYNPADARLATIANNSNSETFTYSYLANSNLISSVTSANSVVNRTYEANRNLLKTLQTSSKTASGAQVLIAAYYYKHDDLGRRIAVKQSGQLYQSYIDTPNNAPWTNYAYNNRNELISASTVVGSADENQNYPIPGNPIPGRSFGYDFDPIGNRTKEVLEGVSHAYSANSLNQYDWRNTPSWLPVSGIASHNGGANSQVEVNGAALPEGNWLNNFYYKAEPKKQTEQDTDARLQPITIAGKSTTGATITETRNPLARPLKEDFTYDLDGNLLSDSLWTYTYDGENRLSTMTSRVPNSPTQCVKFTYDYMGRRVRKDVYTDTAGTNLKTSTTFLYQGWTLLCEYSIGSAGVSPALTLQRRYTWGPDLSGTMGGAGDIGGLLAMEDLRPNWKGTFHPAYDGNGNLMALTEASTGNMVAAHEYDPFGNPLRTSGVYAKENPFRFSGKYYDTETGLSYFGYRYYSASLGRFINRDLLEEQGAWNLYNKLTQVADNPYAGASGVMGTSSQTEWEQAQDRLLENTSMPHTTQKVAFDGKRNSGLPGSSEAGQKTYSANATGHYAQGGAPGTGSQAPDMSVGDPATGNADINLYIYAGNNPINGNDPLGLSFWSRIRDFFKPKPKLETDGEIVHMPTFVVTATMPKQGLSTVISHPPKRITVKQLFGLLSNPPNKKARSEGREISEKLKHVNIVLFDKAILKYTYPDGTVENKETSTSKPLPGNPDLGFYDESTNTMYLFAWLTPLAALELTYHEGIVHVVTKDDNEARGASAEAMERLGYGTQFPNYIKETVSASGEKQRSRNAEAINADVSNNKAYDKKTTIQLMEVWQGIGKNAKRIR